MKRTETPRQFRDALLMPAPRLVERLVGFASALVAVSLTAFAAFILVAIARGRGWPAALWSTFAVTVAVLHFFTTVAYRLLRNKPHRSGSMTSPAAWFACFAVFGLLTAALVVCAVVFRDFSFAQGATLSGLLALLSFGAATHFRQRRQRR